MSLAVGSRVGPYEVVSVIGAGGMGVVYRAHDSRLGRDVAIKTSSERFTERFEREARASAALNHPNICTLHDVGPDYLVMELVEGETLADMLAARPRDAASIPLDEALGIARQIASALEEAHDKGVVHRDLKPGNIKIKPDGTLKVLDFGLAKLPGSVIDSDLGRERLTQSPTIGATQVGLILGTAAYMAPEQARGRVVDKRADIWAFGVVLYEMVTGRPPFEGDDVSTILAAVIQSEPRWDAVPPRVRRLIRKCLEKDPRRRLRDIADAWDLLEADAAPPATPRTSGIGWIVAGAFALATVMALWAPWRSTTVPSDRPLMRLDVDLGADVSLAPLYRPTVSTVAISPDGTRLAFSASVSDRPQALLIRKLDQAKATELPGTQGAIDPLFSPDGQWVVFWDGKRLKKISVEGGAAVPLIDAPIYAGANWTEDNHLLIGSGLTTGLVRIAADGGPATPIAPLQEGELFQATPQILPGGRDVLVSSYSRPPTVDTARIDIVSLKDGSRKTVARGGTSARYLPSGHIVYTNRGRMFAVVFDAAAGETRGTPVQILADLAYDAAANLAQFDVARDGTLVYRGGAGFARPLTTPMWYDQAGNQQPLALKTNDYASEPRLSPDGKRLAIVIREGGTQDVWVYDIERELSTRLTAGEATYVSPVWTRDGEFIVFGTIGNGIFWKRADGAGAAQPLLPRKSILFPMSFSNDGRLTFDEGGSAPQIWTMPVERSGEGLKAGRPEPYSGAPSGGANGMFSPDGRWVAYESNETGRTEVFVTPFPAPAGGQGEKIQISNTGGATPHWSPNAGEIIYRAGDQMMAVAYTVSGRSFIPAKPRVWLETLSGELFDLAPDGKRLMVLMPSGQQVAPNREHTIVFVQNFFDELRRRAPVGK